MFHISLCAYYIWSIFHQKGVRMSQQFIPPAAQTLHSSSILIVEDDENVGEFLQQTIDEFTPYQTTVVHDSFGALERAMQIQPCLLLLDYKLPGLNGLEIYDRLQGMEVTRGVPTIMMSASLPIEELQSRGIYQLKKPMDIGNVLRMITHALATYEERRLGENQPLI
jgi:two-component system response regulator (stage 0 sporulation protein F)